MGNEKSNHPWEGGEVWGNFDMPQNLIWRPLYNTNKDAGNPVATLIFHDAGPYHLETSPLICKAN